MLGRVVVVSCRRFTTKYASRKAKAFPGLSMIRAKYSSEKVSCQYNQARRNPDPLNLADYHFGSARTQEASHVQWRDLYGPSGKKVAFVAEGREEGDA